MRKGIEYKSGYKYQLTRPFSIKLPFLPPPSIFHYNPFITIIREESGETGLGAYSHILCSPFLALYPSGLLHLFTGYAWDGPSGIAFDTLNFMVPSLIHDANYQLMRNKVLPLLPFREKADSLMYEMCRDRGMSFFRAWYCKQGVRKFGRSSATLKRPVHRAP